ncbi:outer membrane autotransporter [Providencia burhodogranariea DSM 19968]|uniref:Outer membrane autotransporter n=2 Tax=Providencia burhodogranariea TaxID=516074 RepID=K8WMA5_9GAMM|nr:outer membrane autotransporter [Providencia burhodogranariea DSM 19968]
MITTSVYADSIEFEKRATLASWHTPEFNHQWGLASIHADSAYAAGYTGKGIKMGIFDMPAYAKHSEFYGENKLIHLITSGVRSGNYLNLLGEKSDEHFYFDGTLHFKDTDGQLVSHGTFVTGIAAANRDGKGIHGVAFDSQIFSADINDGGDFKGDLRGIDEHITQAGWQAFIGSGVRVINNSWTVDLADNFNGLFDDDSSSKPYFSLSDAKVQFEQLNDLLRISKGGAFQGGIDAGNNGILNIIGLGNDGNKSSTSILGGLGYFMPEVAPYWLTVGSVQNKENYISELEINYVWEQLFSLYQGKNPSENSDDHFTQWINELHENNPSIFVNLKKKFNQQLDRSQISDVLLSQFSTPCGYTASYCVVAPGSNLYSTGVIGSEHNKLVAGYQSGSGTSYAAPHVTGAAALLMQRFPYLSGVEISTILKTTATDLGDVGVDSSYGWGLINLEKAINGPAMFVTKDDIPAEFRIPDLERIEAIQFVADIPGIGAILDKGTVRERICNDRHCDSDTYSNDISGHGGLLKKGAGSLILSGNNSYTGLTSINQGTLHIDGSIVSDVIVNKAGVLGGAGKLASFVVNDGGTITANSATGTLQVTNNATFESGSRYIVDIILRDKKAMPLHIGGDVALNGGEVEIELQNQQNLLAQNKVSGFAGQQLTILTAENDIKGQFNHVVSHYPFLTGGLSHQRNKVLLAIQRNQYSFDEAAHTLNERNVAYAIEALSVSSPIYESLLLSNSQQQARQALQQLSGQIHADIASVQINSSRYLRNAIYERLKQAQDRTMLSNLKADQVGNWGQLLQSAGNTSGYGDIEGFDDYTQGVLLGTDRELMGNTRFGIAGGYTRAKLHGRINGSAQSNNYHFAIYGEKTVDALDLHAGGAYMWGHVNTSRSVAYGSQSDKNQAKYQTGTTQLFGGAAYNLKHQWVDLTPFANLAWVNYQNNGFSESGGAAALNGKKQHLNAIFSEIGFGAGKQWPITKNISLELNSQLSWQHQLNNNSRDSVLSFQHSDSAFNVNSVPASRNGMILKTSMAMEINSQLSILVGYNGLLSDHYQDNSVNGHMAWHF